jgi:hypothetical protein
MNSLSLLSLSLLPRRHMMSSTPYVFLMAIMKPTTLVALVKPPAASRYTTKTRKKYRLLSTAAHRRPHRLNFQDLVEWWREKKEVGEDAIHDSDE